MFSYIVTMDAAWGLDDIDEYVLAYSDIDFVESLEREFESAFDSLAANPYAYPEYQFEPPVRMLHRYRSVNVYNYKVFYYVDEARELVIISRVCLKLADFTRRGMW